VRLWKRELQVLANELGIAITVNHLPPGTSKWNRIEHKLFAFITMNWRAKPLVSYLAIIQLIASTTTDTGLTVACQLDANAYEKGIKVSDSEISRLPSFSFHPGLAPIRPDSLPDRGTLGMRVCHGDGSGGPARGRTAEGHPWVY
jgi:hypothetical protein